MVRRRVRFQRLAGSCGFRAAIPVANFEIREGRMPCRHRCPSSGPAAEPDLVSSTTLPARTRGVPPWPCHVTSESIVALLPDSGRKSVILRYRVSSTGLSGLAGTSPMAAARVSATKVTYRLAVELGVLVPGFLRTEGAKRVIENALEKLKRRVEMG